MKRSLPFILILLLIGGCIWAQENLRERGSKLSLLMERADSGDAKALYDLAYLHDIGFDTISVDTVLSTALYLKSAEKGYAPAMNFIGFRYYKGESVDKNIDSALYWIRKAGDAGDITAAANLGYLLTEGEGVKHDEEEAVKWLTIAAEEGVKEAQLKLLDLQQDIWDALPPDSALSLGAHYYTGKAPIIGTHILKNAADAGNSKALALLGDAYSKGFGVPYNHQLAIDYFYQAAVGGDPSAQFILGELLEIFPDALNNQKDISPSQTISQYWFEKAEQKGVTDSESAYQELINIP